MHDFDLFMCGWMFGSVCGCILTAFLYNVYMHWHDD